VGLNDETSKPIDGQIIETKCLFIYHEQSIP